MVEHDSLGLSPVELMHNRPGTSTTAPRVDALRSRFELVTQGRGLRSSLRSHALMEEELAALALSSGAAEPPVERSGADRRWPPGGPERAL